MASMWPPKKNTEFKLYFSLYKTDNTIIANPGTITKKVSIDGAAVADIAASVTEEDTTYGQLSVVLSAAEMNGKCTAFHNAVAVWRPTSVLVTKSILPSSRRGRPPP